MRHLFALGCAIIVATPALAIDIMYFDRPSFLADPRIGATEEMLFDDPGQLDANFNGANILGATLTSPDTLIVIDATTGVRFPMTTSSGTQLLSPGGQSAASQNDDLMITFDTPRQSFGLDVVFDAPDGASFVAVTFYDVTGHVISENSFIPCPAGAPGYQFVGLVSDGPAIAGILFNEFDDTAGDDNVGYDSLIFSAIPAPGTLALLGLSALASRRRR